MITHPLLNSNGILSTLELFQVQNYPQHTRILDGHLWVPNWVKCFCTKKEHTFTLEATLHAISRGRLFTGVPLRATFGALLMMGKRESWRTFSPLSSMLINLMLKAHQTLIFHTLSRPHKKGDSLFSLAAMTLHIIDEVWKFQHQAKMIYHVLNHNQWHFCPDFIFI